MLFSTHPELLTAMETQYLRTPQGRALAYRHLRAGNGIGVIMSHGFLADKSEGGRFDRLASLLQSEGIDAISFDYSGCGESEETPISLDAFHEDLDAVGDYARNEGLARLGLVGFSFGGYLALEYLKRSGARCALLWAPVTDALPVPNRIITAENLEELERAEKTIVRTKHGLRTVFVLLKSFIEQRNAIDQSRLLTGIDQRVLIIHGTEDASVPLEHSIRAVRMLPNAEIIELVGANHFFKGHEGRLIEESVGFLTHELLE